MTRPRNSSATRRSPLFGIGLLLLASAWLSPWATAAEGDEAVTVVKRLQAGLLKLDRENAKRTNRQRYEVFAPLIEDTHDLDFMARLTVSRFWPSLTPEQRQGFEEAFRHVSVMGYASRFRDTVGNVFQVDQVRMVSGERVEVATRLLAPSEPAVSLNYILHKDKSGWRIINILAEGVSDLALQRSQYQQIMQNKGFDALLQHLGEKNSELAATP
jgi:phospholipid transport system substrate-binding protein